MLGTRPASSLTADPKSNMLLSLVTMLSTRTNGTGWPLATNAREVIWASISLRSRAKTFHRVTRVKSQEVMDGLANLETLGNKPHTRGGHNFLCTCGGLLQIHEWVGGIGHR